MRKNFFCALLVISWLFPACQQDEITSVRVPKEAPPSVPASQTSGAGSKIHWIVPSSWVEQAPSAMRVGSFQYKREDGQVVDISVVPLSGEAGGLLANINRWRGQIQLSPLSEADLPAQLKTIHPAGRSMIYVEFANQQKKIVAAIYNQNGQTWFFKMTGEETAVQSQEAVFQTFLEGLRFDDHS